MRIMPSREYKNGVILSILKETTSSTRHYQLHGTITKFSERHILPSSNDYVIADLDFKKLSSPDEIAPHSNISIGKRSLFAWVTKKDGL